VKSVGDAAPARKCPRCSRRCSLAARRGGSGASARAATRAPRFDLIRLTADKEYLRVHLATARGAARRRETGVADWILGLLALTSIAGLPGAAARHCSAGALLRHPREVCRIVRRRCASKDPRSAPSRGRRFPRRAALVITATPRRAPLASGDVRRQIGLKLRARRMQSALRHVASRGPSRSSWCRRRRTPGPALHSRLRHARSYEPHASKRRRLPRLITRRPKTRM